MLYSPTLKRLVHCPLSCRGSKSMFFLIISLFHSSVLIVFFLLHLNNGKWDTRGGRWSWPRKHGRCGSITVPTCMDMNLCRSRGDPHILSCILAMEYFVIYVTFLTALLLPVLSTRTGRRIARCML